MRTWLEDSTRGLSSTNMSTRVNRVNPFLRSRLQFSSKRKNLNIHCHIEGWIGGVIDIVLHKLLTGIKRSTNITLIFHSNLKKEYFPFKNVLNYFPRFHHNSGSPLSRIPGISGECLNRKTCSRKTASQFLVRGRLSPGKH